MILARVTGEVVASQKHPSHEGLKLLRVQPENSSTPQHLIAMDAVGAGIGERVIVVQDGFAAMTAVNRPQSPIDCAVIGIVDSTNEI
ncbi:MAG TPA: EutN/CcmL family microcompartment protein [Terriglobales bacterium]|nr:EutN/CcmL family microcompartment protein [Terriglobales bacterium]